MSARPPAVPPSEEVTGTGRRPRFGTPERIAACKRHRPADGIALATGKPNGRLGCWFCGADLGAAR